VMLSGVKIGKSNAMPLILKGLVSIIGSGNILHFHHKSFEDYFLSSSFLQNFPEFSTVWDQGCHECQLAIVCLKTLVSPKLHFNMCSLDSSVIMNADIQPDIKSAERGKRGFNCDKQREKSSNSPQLHAKGFVGRRKWGYQKEIKIWKCNLSVM